MFLACLGFGRDIRDDQVPSPCFGYDPDSPRGNAAYIVSCVGMRRAVAVVSLLGLLVFGSSRAGFPLRLFPFEYAWQGCRHSTVYKYSIRCYNGLHIDRIPPARLSPEMTIMSWCGFPISSSVFY